MNAGERRGKREDQRDYPKIRKEKEERFASHLLSFQDAPRPPLLPRSTPFSSGHSRPPRGLALSHVLCDSRGFTARYRACFCFFPSSPFTAGGDLFSFSFSGLVGRRHRLLGLCGREVATGGRPPEGDSSLRGICGSRGRRSSRSHASCVISETKCTAWAGPANWRGTVLNASAGKPPHKAEDNYSYCYWVWCWEEAGEGKQPVLKPVERNPYDTQ